MSDEKAGGSAVVAALVLAPIAFVLAIVFLLLFILTGARASGSPACGDDPASGQITLPTEPVAGYDLEQLGNAAAIASVAAAMGLPTRAQIIGVMTAMGESSLRVVGHGDAAGPDSRGLFQQRENWGPLSVRMDPAGSAGLFFTALAAVPGWESLDPSAAAHSVQRNANPNHYTPYWPAAQEVVSALVGNAVCTSGAVHGNWALPLDGFVTSGYGFRIDFNGVPGFHGGVDMDNGGPNPIGCGAPVWAVGSGTVTRTFQDQYGGWIIEIDHGGGVQSWTVHSEAEGILVRAEQQVAAGQQIATLGSSGYSSGCHLHFEIRIDGTQTDPLAFLAQQGVPAPRSR